MKKVLFGTLLLLVMVVVARGYLRSLIPSRRGDAPGELDYLVGEVAIATEDMPANGFGKAEDVADVQTKITADFKVRVSYSPADMSKPAAIREMMSSQVFSSASSR